MRFGGKCEDSGWGSVVVGVVLGMNECEVRRVKLSSATMIAKAIISRYF